jgi:hypothetical protein
MPAKRQPSVQSQPVRHWGIVAGHAMPKALRHAFRVGGTQTGVLLNIIQRWLGHADIQATAIYTDVMGDEERLLADRMWVREGNPFPAGFSGTRLHQSEPEPKLRTILRTNRAPIEFPAQRVEQGTPVRPGRSPSRRGARGARAFTTQAGAH